jgi:hypothetical protein
VIGLQVFPDVRTHLSQRNLVREHTGTPATDCEEEYTPEFLFVFETVNSEEGKSAAYECRKSDCRPHGATSKNFESAGLPNGHPPIFGQAD